MGGGERNKMERGRWEWLVILPSDDSPEQKRELLYVLAATMMVRGRNLQKCAETPATTPVFSSPSGASSMYLPSTYNKGRQ